MLEKFDSLIANNNMNVIAWKAYVNGEEDKKVYKKVSPCQKIYSITKSVVCCLIGTLYDDGLLSPNDYISKYFDDVELGKGWEKVRIRDLLTQTPGIDSLVYDTVEHSMDKNENHLHFALNRQLVHEPGKHFEYNDANYYILSCLVEKVSGMEFESFLRKKLFNPLGIRNFAIQKSKDERFLGGSGLYMSIDDIYKYGLMLLNDGEYEGKRILSKEWLDMARSVPENDNTGINYGFAFRLPNEYTSCATGAFNQLILVSKKHNAIVAIQSFDETPDIYKLVLDALE